MIPVVKKPKTRRRSPGHETELPDFLVIGGVRCGTTSLYHYLRQHPGVFMPSLKEPSYFIRSPGEETSEHDGPTVTRWDEYVDLFRAADGGAAVGEASAIYLYRAELAAPRIREELGDVRIVCLLRNPVERSFSQYRMAVREGAEDASTFREGLRREDRRVSEGAHPIFHYFRQSQYAEGVEIYQELFGTDGLRVYLFEDFVEDPAAVVRDVYEFIGVDPGFAPDTSRIHNSTRGPRWPRIEELLQHSRRAQRVLRALLPGHTWRELRGRLRRANLAEQEIESALRERLQDSFRPDVRRLEELLGRDLSTWLDPAE